MTQKSDYVVQQGRFVLGVWHEKGDVVALTDRQAKYLAPPYGNDVAPRQVEEPAAEVEASNPGAADEPLPVAGSGREKGKR